jgi:hypothetical protein
VKQSLFCLLALAPLGAASVSSAQAAPALGFDMSMRIAATGKSSMAPQVVQTHVLLSGQRARVDTSVGGTRAVVLYAPPYVYRLLPASKAGTRWKAPKNQTAQFGGFDPQQILRNPSLIRTSLLQNGAKLTGKSQLGGVPVDVYQMAKPAQGLSRVKAYLRRSDSLPLRFEAQVNGLQVVAIWSRYTRLPNVAASQFTPPKGYSIRETQNAPMIPTL